MNERINMIADRPPRHYILETMYCELETGRLLCGGRVACSDFPGIWLVNGILHLCWHDSFEMIDRTVGIDEYRERVTRMRSYSLSIHPAIKRLR